jgi:hypothetical protein
MRAYTYMKLSLSAGAQENETAENLSNLSGQEQTRAEKSRYVRRVSSRL